MDSEMMTSFGTWAPILLMVLIFYFLLYRPQKKAQKKRQDMISALKKGTRVVTLGGIYGTIVSAGENTLQLEIAKDVVIEIARAGISSIVPDKAESKDENA